MELCRANADLMKKGLRRLCPLAFLPKLGANADLMKKGLRHMQATHVYPDATGERRPDEEGIETFIVLLLLS